MRLRIDQLQLDGGTQPRAGIDQNTVRDYADALQAEAAFPPVTVFHDGAAYWLADGFHRVHAHKLLDWLEVDAEVHQGTRRDAVLYSVGANASHGLRRTNADKRRAVETLLRDEEWGKWSDREIARRTGVSPDTVGRIRSELPPSLSDSDSEPTERTYTTKHGTTSRMNTAGLKSRPQVQPVPTPEPAFPSHDPETGEVHGATFPPELLKAAHAPMSPAPYEPPHHEDVLRDARVEEARRAFGVLRAKLDALRPGDLETLTGSALAGVLVTHAREWLLLLSAHKQTDDKTLEAQTWN